MSDIEKRLAFMVMLFPWAGAAHLLGVGYYIWGSIALVFFIFAFTFNKKIRDLILFRKWVFIVMLVFWLIFFSISILSQVAGTSIDKIKIVNFILIAVYGVFCIYVVEKLPYRRNG